MKERPILFSGEMVRALLDGRKTQTRRVIKPQPRDVHAELARHAKPKELGCPHGQPGDLLWVRETWKPLHSENDILYRASHGEITRHLDQDKWFEIDWRKRKDGWRPSIHMPRWASRITLRVKDVRVERVQEISPEDAMAEGIRHIARWGPRGELIQAMLDAPETFASLWNSINAKRGFGWDANPWVWVVEFEKAAALEEK